MHNNCPVAPSIMAKGSFLQVRLSILETTLSYQFILYLLWCKNKCADSYQASVALQYIPAPF